VDFRAEIQNKQALQYVRS